MSFDFERFASMVDESLIVDLAKEVIRTPSPTGEEYDFAVLLSTVYSELGLDTELQTLYSERVNVAGRLRGNGVGPHVLLSGHLDTSVRGDESWLVGDGWKNEPLIEDRIIWGNGIFNMKGAFVCYAAMLDAMRRAGTHFPGDLLVAGTCGEIELGSVDEFTGRNYDSQGVGLRYLLQHGYVADYHILGEPTGLVPHVGHMGSTWAKVTTTGSFTHSAWADQSTNAIDEMLIIREELEPWVADFKVRNEFRGVQPQVNFAAIRGGHPWRAARTPSVCNLYVDIRFPPDAFPIDVQREFTEQVLQVAGSKLRNTPKVDWYMSRPGALVSAESPVVKGMAAAHNLATGTAIEPAFGPPWCSDAIDSNRLGIPTVLYGLGRTRIDDSASANASGDPRSARGEYVDIDDMVDATRAYGAAVASLMGLDVADVHSTRSPMPSIEH
jgi:acetylornithine deacetylase/succinyl-diaminopimelate desuccinylase-like protein